MEDELAQRHLAPIPEHLRLESYHVVWPDGSYHSGGRGVIPLFEHLRPVQWLGRVLRTLRATPLLELLYRAVSSQRGRLARVVRDAEGPRRYP